MGATYTFKGLPFYNENGKVKYVTPFRALRNEQDLKYYKGEKSVDSNGNVFCYNKVSNTYSPTPPARPQSIFVGDMEYAVDDLQTFIANHSGTSSSQPSIIDFNFVSDGVSISIPMNTVTKVLFTNPITLNLTGNYFMSHLFRRCVNLAECDLNGISLNRNGVTSASYYLYSCFNTCKNLTTAPTIPPLPSGVISANYYLSYCFYGCTLLTNDLISNVPALIGTYPSSVNYVTSNYAGGTCPATPDTPLTSTTYMNGYNYH
jgi:hypothetical protein